MKQVAIILAVLTIIVLVAIGCRAEPVQTSQTNNKEVPVSLLFEFEGVRVYRFEDGGNARYYAVARPGYQVSTNWSENCGKNCVRNLGIDTVETH